LLEEGDHINGEYLKSLENERLCQKDQGEENE
jgi:hypothetical protein